jgi:hyperosmotically inducible protein
MRSTYAIALIAAAGLAAPMGALANDTTKHTQATTTQSTQPMTTTEKAKEAVSDSVITTKVKAELAKEKNVSATHIKVDTDNSGVVTLSGTAKSQQEAERAAQIARDTKGVTSVNNRIMVDASAKY